MAHGEKPKTKEEDKKKKKSYSYAFEDFDSHVVESGLAIADAMFAVSADKEIVREITKNDRKSTQSPRPKSAQKKKPEEREDPFSKKRKKNPKGGS